MPQILEETKKLFKKDLSLENVLKAIVLGEGSTNIELKEVQMCHRCKIPLQVQKKHLLDVPNCFALGLQYENIDCEMTTADLTTLYSLIPNKLDISKFLQITNSAKSQMTTTYVFRGVIMYYGRHYYAYFYSEKYDCWF